MSTPSSIRLSPAAKGQPLYQKIAGLLEQQITNQTLRAGDKLPSVRTLREVHGVSINTAIQALLELERKALVEARPKSGYYVSHLTRTTLALPPVSVLQVAQQEPTPDELIDRVFATLGDKSLTQFSLGVPDETLLPVARLNKGVTQALRELAGSGLDFDLVQEHLGLRRNIAKATQAWGGQLQPEQLITTSGTMNAICYCLSAVTKPGDTIALESPVFFGLLQLAQSLGLRVIELPTHPQTGIELDALKKVLPKLRACLLVANFSNPLGSCMPDEHKQEVVRLLAAHNVPLIEDDIYGDLFFGSARPRPCKAYDEQGLVLWCGSVTKTLAPGYRVGWVDAGRFHPQVLRLKRLQTIATPALYQEVIAHFMEKGRYEQHLRHLRTALHANSLHFRQAIAQHFPDDTRVTHPQGGFVLWVDLNRRVHTSRLFEQALARGISIAPGRMFTQHAQFTNCLRLSFGMQWTEAVHHQLQVLGNLVKASL